MTQGSGLTEMSGLVQGNQELELFDIHGSALLMGFEKAKPSLQGIGESKRCKTSR
jgi:hypothetical protein